MAMEDTHDLVGEVEDELTSLEQHAKHVVSLLGRRVVSLEERVTALQESSLLFQEIRQIREKVQALRRKP